MPTENLEFPEYLDFAKRKVPPSLHENVFAAKGFDHDPIVGAVRSALLEGRQAAERSLEIAASVLIDDSLTEPARHQVARAHIFKATEPALKRMQTIIETVTKKISDLENFLAGPPKPTVATAHWEAMEARNVLAGMDRDKRRVIIRNAIRDGDQALAAAVLRCPSWYLGMEPAEQDQFRLEWAQASHPQEVALLAVLKDTATHLERGGKLLLDYSITLTNSQLVARAEKARQRTAAAMQGLAA